MVKQPKRLGRREISYLNWNVNKLDIETRNEMGKKSSTHCPKLCWRALDCFYFIMTWEIWNPNGELDIYLVQWNTLMWITAQSDGCNGEWEGWQVYEIKLFFNSIKDDERNLIIPRTYSIATSNFIAVVPTMMGDDLMQSTSQQLPRGQWNGDFLFIICITL